MTTSVQLYSNEDTNEEANEGEEEQK